jgi:copper chaperone CopZ
MSNLTDTHDTSAWSSEHWIRIPALNREADAIAIKSALGKLPGILKVRISIERKKIRVQYDQTKVDFLQLKNQLEEVGFPTDDSWWCRKKEHWLKRYTVFESIEKPGWYSSAPVVGIRTQMSRI